MSCTVQILANMIVPAVRAGVLVINIHTIFGSHTFSTTDPDMIKSKLSTSAFTA